MMRLIDADALKANCDIMVGDTTIGRRDYVMFYEIDSAPIIDIVRCAECKYYNSEYCFRLVSKDVWDIIGSQCVIIMQPNDFCSYGERKESK